MARQAAADRDWEAVARFYKNCREQKPGKKGYPRFQKDIRSVEYTTSGWMLEPDGKHLTFTDGHGIGILRLVGKKGKIETFPQVQMKRVRLLKRADGYYVQFAVQADRQIAHVPAGKQAGIDVGLKSFYTDSDGNTVENPRSSQQSGNETQASASARLAQSQAVQESQEGDPTTGKGLSPGE
jgi:putative transposase